MPSSLEFNKAFPEWKDKIAALFIARAEMETITAELQMNQAIRSKFPPSTHFVLSPDPTVRANKEKKNGGVGPLR